MSTIYSNPEEFGLEIVDSWDFSDQSYQFDLRVVWRVKSTGNLLTGRSSGCSCPEPFENMGRDSLLPASKSKLKQEAIEEATTEWYNGHPLSKILEKIRRLK